MQLAERVQRFLAAQSEQAAEQEAQEAAPEAAADNGAALLHDRDDVAFDAAAAELDALEADDVAEEELAAPSEPGGVAGGGAPRTSGGA